MEPLRIVVADDDPTLQLLLEHALRRDARFELVGVVEDGRLVLELVTSTDADVLVLDLDLPGATGLQVLAELADRARPTVVVMSSSGRRARERAMAAGAHAFLDKLQVVDDLADAIHAAVVDAPPS